jgi:predicted nucleotidyltransferase
MMDDKRKKIFFTVVYFNAINRPPTTFEVWRFLIDLAGEKTACSFDEVAENLKNLSRKNKIMEKKGFWVLPGKEGKANTRIALQKISFAKTKKAAKRARLLELMPYCRGAFFTGALAFSNCKKDSDWDILIVLKKNRIWIGRLFVSIFLIILGKKRTEKKSENKFCLNHFVAEDNLIFPDRNEYSALGVALMFPVFGKKYFDKMQQINFAWQRLYLPNYNKDATGNNLFLKESAFFEKVRNFIEAILEKSGAGSFLNNKSKSLMIKKIEKNPKTYWENALVVYNDGEMAFWPAPKRIENLDKVKKFFK